MRHIKLCWCIEAIHWALAWKSPFAIRRLLWLWIAARHHLFHTLKWELIWHCAGRAHSKLIFRSVLTIYSQVWFISREANDRRIKDLHPSIRSIQAPSLTWALTSQRRIMIAFESYDSFTKNNFLFLECTKIQLSVFSQLTRWPVWEIGNPHKH